jgi:hypothetical protein
MPHVIVGGRGAKPGHRVPVAQSRDVCGNGARFSISQKADERLSPRLNAS